MKFLPFILALLYTGVIQLFAQNNNSFNISMERVAESKKDWNIVLTIELNESLRDGLALELPSRIKMVPTEVRLGNEKLWLKKSNDAPTLEQTLTWFEDDSGRILLRFTENRLNAGDRLIISCTTHMKQPPQEEARVALLRLDRVGEGVRTSEQIMDSRSLPTIQEN
jgi:hypothetical protein